MTGSLFQPRFSIVPKRHLRERIFAESDFESGVLRASFSADIRHQNPVQGHLNY